MNSLPIELRLLPLHVITASTNPPLCTSELDLATIPARVGLSARAVVTLIRNRNVPSECLANQTAN